MQSLKRPSHKRKWVLLLTLLLLLAVLYQYSPKSSGPESVAEKALVPQITITDADLRTDSSNASVTDLTQERGIFRITEAGTHLLCGTFRGTVEVDVQDQMVQLILGGVDIEAESGPALHIVSAGKVILTIPEGAENSLRDSGYYPQGTEPDACIYSPCDLSINGPGSLNVSGYFKDAIHSKDTLKILGGNVFVQAKRDGLHGNDGIVLSCQSVNVESERHGLNSTKSGKPGKGNIEICSGTNSIIAGGYGISCAADLYIGECSLYVTGILDTYRAQGRTSIAEGVLG